MICAGCGLDLTSMPKIPRNLGPTSNSSSDVRGRVVDLWKELASEIQQNMVIIYDMKMCRTRFNDFDNSVSSSVLVHELLIHSPSQPIQKNLKQMFLENGISIV